MDTGLPASMHSPLKSRGTAINAIRSPRTLWDRSQDPPVDPIHIVGSASRSTGSGSSGPRNTTFPGQEKTVIMHLTKIVKKAIFELTGRCFSALKSPHGQAGSSRIQQAGNADDRVADARGEELRDSPRVGSIYAVCEQSDVADIPQGRGRRRGAANALGDQERDGRSVAGDGGGARDSTSKGLQAADQAGAVAAAGVASGF